MRRVGLVLAAMALALLLASGVALAVNKVGTDGRNFLKGTNGDDNLLGKGGNDLIFGLVGDDNLLGGSGKDLVFGGTLERSLGGSKNVAGGDGNDGVLGGKGSDKVMGEKVTTTCLRAPSPTSPSSINSPPETATTRSGS
jgi:Ca2+-binding RTX toxin-like protein